MKANEIMSKASGALNKIGFGLKKRSPEILVAVGVVGTVVSAVMACKATTKIDTILDETKDQLDKIHEYAGNPDVAEKYNAEDAKKDTAIVYAQAGVKLAKLYAPAVGLGILSISSILASNNILRKRNMAISAALAAATQDFKDYRNRVIERFGKEVDHQLRYNIKAEEIEETVTDEKGKEKKVKKSIEVADPNASGYVKYFTRSNPYWEEDSSYVEMFLRSQQNFANDKLKANGHLTLNEVYDMLGFHDSKAGMVVGWIYDLDHPNGDNYVEFDVKKVNLPNEQGGYEEAYAIDFNVDGNIYNEMI
ncbi:DUF6353 family protein [uncultured Bacteroides sp.]|uniref:DUF6353 family protein n=1 Tax=uncultured Bacteroides sp. TaxID=162156 RepID=UPI00272C8AC6|nr:DUF6353 family protein [uncultured Bacteroides sp.]